MRFQLEYIYDSLIPMMLIKSQFFNERIDMKTKQDIQCEVE